MLAFAAEREEANNQPIYTQESGRGYQMPAIIKKRKYSKYMSPTLITREEAAQMLGVHPITISRLEKRGLFPVSLRLGRGVLRYNRRAVEDFLAKR